MISGVISRLRRAAHKTRADNIAQITPQFAPYATLDHRPLPPGELTDPDLLSRLLVDSSLADLCEPPEPKLVELKTTDVFASFRAISAENEFAGDCLEFQLARIDPFSPWLVTSISALHRPPITPRSKSP